MLTTNFFRGILRDFRRLRAFFKRFLGQPISAVETNTQYDQI